DDSARALDRIAFLDIAVVTEDHDADIVGLEVQGHAAYAAGELDHLASFNLVEAVDAGDAVADREHRADLRDIGLGAEVLDLLLEDGGDFCGADFHHPTPFIASCSLCSFVLSELSTMRLPTLTTRPPISAGSTFMSTATLPPTLRRMASASAACCCSFSGLAAVTSACISPRRRASSARNSSIICGSANSRRLRATSPTNLRTRSEVPACCSSAAIARACSSRDRIGLRSRERKASLPPIIAFRSE